MRINLPALLTVLLATAFTNVKAQDNMDKSFINLATERYSVRSFTDQKVEQDKLDLILRAGQVAPTAVNKQPQKIYVLRSEEAIRKIKSVSPCIYGAPQVFLVCYDENICWKNNGNDGHSSGEMDATIVLTHMMLQAAELGIGTCWVCYFDMKKTAELFDLPDHIKPMALMPFGYPAKNSKPAAMHSKRRPIDETVSIL